MIYLDNAATTFPKPRSVIREVERCLCEYCGNPGRGGHRLSMKAAEAVYSVRCAVCDEFGGLPENVVFTHNATDALNLAIKSLARRHKDGGHILISSLEHNSVRRPCAALAEYGFEYSTFDVPTVPCHDRVICAAFERELRDDTKFAVVCHASNICGITLPIRAIGEVCRRRGIPLVVDASQSAGLYDIDIGKMNIGILCCPGHKSLYGIQGGGFALFSADCASPDFWADVTYAQGGSGVSSLDEGMPRELPERFEAGTLAVPSVAALGAGLRFVSSSRHELREHEAKLIRRLRYMLLNTRGVKVYAPNFDNTNLLLFSQSGVPSDRTAALLDDAGICVRAGLHCSPLAHKLLGTPEDGAVRVSVGAFNSAADVEGVWRAIAR